MKKLLLASFLGIVLSGCAGNMRGPAPLGDGSYIIGSYSKKLSSEKVVMLQKADNFCRERNKNMKVKSISVADRRSGQKVAVAIVEAIMFKAGNIELIFTCEKSREEP